VVIVCNSLEEAIWLVSDLAEDVLPEVRVDQHTEVAGEEILLASGRWSRVRPAAYEDVADEACWRVLLLGRFERRGTGRLEVYGRLESRGGVLRGRVAGVGVASP